MHEFSTIRTSPINVSVIGYCGSSNSARCRVGKSCLISRFMHWNSYTEDHLSVVSNSDYHGSVVSASHWLYWGSRRIECCSRTFSLRIIEQCDFIDDHLFTPVAKKPYTERCFATDIRVETPKLAYICKEQLGHEWKYNREVLEAGVFSVNVFVLVSDTTLTGEAAHLQECFLAQALPRLCKLKLPFILATSKHDCLAPPENQIFLNRLMKQYKKALHKNKFCRFETSARLGVNVSELFMSAALMASSHSHDLNGRHFRYYTPDHLTDEIINGYWQHSPSIRRNGRKMDAISSLYADTNTMHLQPNSKMFCQPAPSCVSEDLTYDLPVNEDPDPGPDACVHGITEQPQVGTASPAAMSAITTTTVSPVSVNVDVNFCEITIIPSPLPPPFISANSHLPTNAPAIANASVLARSHRAHNRHSRQLHQPLLQSEFSDANPEILSLTMEDSGAFHPLLLLFLRGPQASNLRSVLHAKCQLDRFQLADGRWFRIWIFDAVDALGMQISPSKWQPPHTMKPSSTVPSAFSKLLPSSCIDSPRGASVSSAAESSITGNSFSSSTAANHAGCGTNGQNDHSERNLHSFESTNQLRLTLWVGGASDFLAATEQSDGISTDALSGVSTDCHLDALVWFSSKDECLIHQTTLVSTSGQSSPPPIDSCLSTRPITLDRSLDLASSLGIPLFHIRDSSAAQFLSHILPFVGPITARIKAVQQSQVTLSDSDSDPSPPLLFHDLPIPLEVLCQLCRGPDDIPVTAATEPSSRVLSTTLSSLRCSVSMGATHEDRDRPSVAIGIDYVNCPASGSSEGPPLVLFTTVSQALKLLSSETNTEDQTNKRSSLRFRFVILHFLAALWPRIGAKISAQLPSLLNASYAYCQSRSANTACRLLLPARVGCCSSTSSLESVVKACDVDVGSSATPENTLLVALVALTADPATAVSVSTAGVRAGRQLVSGLAALQCCPVMHPRLLYGGIYYPQCCYSPVLGSESGDERAHDYASKPSLAFLHLNGSAETDFELYQQILRVDMSGWLTSCSPTFRMVSVGGRCSRGDSCEVCHKQTDSNLLKTTSLQDLASQSSTYSAWPLPITDHVCFSPSQTAHWAGLTDGLYADAGYSFSTPKTAAATARASEPRLREEGATTAVSEDRLFEYYADFPTLRPDLAPVHRVIRPKRPQVRSSRCSSMGSLTVSTVVTSSNSSPERPPSIQSSVSSSSTPPTSFVPDSGGGTGVAFGFGAGRAAINDSGVVLLSRLSRQTLTAPLCSQHTDSFTDSGAYPCPQHVCVSSSSSAMAAKAMIGRGSSAPKVGSGPLVSASSPATLPLTGPPQTREGSLTTESVSELSEYVAAEETCHFRVDDARLTQYPQRPEIGDSGAYWCDEEQLKELHWKLSSQVNRCSIVAPNHVLAPLLVDRTLLATSNEINVYDVPQSEYYLLDQTSGDGATVYTKEGAQEVTFCHQCQPEEPLVVPIQLSNRASSPALAAYSRPAPPQRPPPAFGRSCGGWLSADCFSLPRSQSSTCTATSDTFYFAPGTDSKTFVGASSSRLVDSLPALENTTLKSAAVKRESPTLNPKPPIMSLSSANNVGCRSYRQSTYQVRVSLFLSNRVSCMSKEEEED
ncbi:unnamed protein product [Schistocephalus solidus]|uniref:Rho GTPase-activating protein 20 n=1 Tax=Schistocephalus solidus TaxID=70667 RepID=A0A183SUR3_SCHSO|nr:unnamed protein product [Schistocephalus solidus]